MPDITWAEVLLRLVVAGALGGLIGTERELRDHEAGLRTHALVAMGAGLFTLVSAYAWTDWSFSTRDGIVFDPTRIAAQVVTGIGFLGAGAIIRHGLSIRGLTTAATLWIVAAIGMAAGVGYYEGALVATGLVLLVLWPLRVLGRRVLGTVAQPAGRLEVLIGRGASTAPIIEALEGAGASLRTFELEDAADGRRVVATARLETGASPTRLVAGLLDLEGVRGANWTD